MAYRLLLSGSHRNANPTQRTNPFTNEVLTFHSYEMSEQEQRDTSAVLARHGATEDEDGERNVVLPDGAKVRIEVGSALESERQSWTASGKILSEDVIGLLFELASAGNLLIGDDEPRVVTSKATKTRAKELRDIECVVVGSAKQLAASLGSAK